MSSFVHRRTTTARLRENPNTTSGSSSGARRPKSTASDAAVDDAPARVEPHALRRKKSVAHPAASGSGTQAGSVRPQRGPAPITELGEHGRKSGHRPLSRSSDVEVQVMLDPPRSQRKHGKSKRKDRSHSRGPSDRPSVRSFNPNAQTADDAAELRHLHGSAGIEEYLKLKEELETMKKQVSSFKKNIGKQSKIIDDLKKELVSAQQSHQEERKQVKELQSRSKKHDEAISTIEANMNCQICMDMLLKPYGLSPCGHVLCLSCLQNWFRTAPIADDDMHDDDPHVLLFRKKTCPVCRTAVLGRPIPVFLIKSIAAALEKVRDNGSSSPRSSPLPEGDPWAGIFPELMSADDMWVDDEDDYLDDDAGQDSEGEVFADAWGSDDGGDWPFDGYGTDEDEAPYEGEYLPARWAPPILDVHSDDYPFDDINDEMLSMLRRGATMPMIEIFEMSYSHDEGLRAIIGDNIVFLGWNIDLHPTDETGEEYMEWVGADVYNHPERWDKESNFDGTWTAWKLTREDEDVEYQPTDSDEYEPYEDTVDDLD
ncbi:uncharacterized protein PHACADRAFT_154728 [Phanerochaete carnosa HHB-10118-sp]|uniref:RING-type domain-containing protein n=1 Tax=Phanerochaete carnosa (strain HHB-10118-sp) TaxID=650164 RepID=K5VQN7_PHACS|nr:uncharacterized protein PHACADRAFT_154728 [Phanerochaete carnosa HHB-10118-sp]EKM49055.1 hypothetical protein PHACADRAFT_154728 [Phanerochaete carnosa HHB-10118-sp]